MCYDMREQVMAVIAQIIRLVAEQFAANHRVLMHTEHIKQMAAEVGYGLPR